MIPKNKITKNRINKNGVMYTLTLSLLAFLLLGLALLVLSHQQSSSSTLSRLHFTQKMHDMDNSAQQVLGEAFLHTTGITLSSSSSSVTVSENIPLSFANTDELLNTLRQSLEQSFTSLNVSVAPSSSRTLLIAPLNISYIHTGSDGIRIPSHPNIT